MSQRTTRPERRGQGDRFWMTMNTDEVAALPSAAPRRMARNEVSLVSDRLDEVTGKAMETAMKVVELAGNARVRTAYSTFGIERPSIWRSLLEVMSIPTLEPIQEWEGHVVDVGDEYFTARLLDVTGGSDYPEEEAEILRRELSSVDNHRLCVGSTFRWIVGYEHYRGEQKRRISQITLHDFRSSRDVDWNQGRRWADKIRKALT